MSYVDPHKAAPSGLTFLKRQREIWCSWVQQAACVALVGVSVRNSNAPDAHLWEPLRKTNAQILYVSPRDGNAFQMWAADYGRHGDEMIPDTWNDAFDKIIDFLRSHDRQTGRT